MINSGLFTSTTDLWSTPKESNEVTRKFGIKNGNNK